MIPPAILVVIPPVILPAILGVIPPAILGVILPVIAEVGLRQYGILRKALTPFYMTFAQ